MSEKGEQVTRDPEMLVVNQAKMTLGNNPKAKTIYCNSSGSLKSHISPCFFCGKCVRAFSIFYVAESLKFWKVDRMITDVELNNTSNNYFLTVLFP
jgi:hypothetical protein